MITRLALLLLWLAASLASARAEAVEHPVSVVEADIYVNRFKTTMRLKCFAEDLELLQGVAPLDDGFYDSEELREATKDHADYLAERIQIINAAGEQLKPKIVQIVDIQFPEENDGRIASGQLMSFQIGYTLEYTYPEPPEFLTINQQMVAEGALLPSEFKILLKQAGSDAPYVKMIKPDMPDTIRFDWDKPILSSDASDKEWDEWFDDQRTKTLGITSYSSVYSFIYITHYEVRHEILIPLATLATMIDFEREDPAFLSIEEQDASVEKIMALFGTGNPVEIDGVEVQPVFDRIDFYGLDLRDFAMQAERRPISMANGRVGLILSYSTKGTPREVKVTWDQFNTAIKTVDSVVFPFDEVLKFRFSMFTDENTYIWTEPDRESLPAVTNVSAGWPEGSIPPEMVRGTDKINVPILTGVLGILGLGLAGFWMARSKQWLWVVAALACAAGAYLTRGIATVPVEFSTSRPEFVMPDEKAEQVFDQLHKNMFRAFDYRQESDIYDALAKSVEGNLLRDLFLKINESLKVREQGGAVARIDEVQIVEGEPIPPAEESVFLVDQPGFNYRCRWNLIGSIEHWGHLHQRTNQYDARFEVRLVDDAWKITDMTMIGDPQPGQVKTSLRKF